MITKTLETIGLTERQAKLYITGLKSWASSAREIAEQARENRITTYKTLKEMVLLWYAKESMKEKKAYFSMINPDEILEQQEKKTRVLKESMPELVWLMKSFWDEPKVMIYDGLEGLKKFFIESLETNEDFRVFIWGKAEQENIEFNNFIKNTFIPQRLLKVPLTKAIVSKKNPNYTNYFKEDLSYVFTENNLFEAANDIIIYDYTKVAICLYEKENLVAFVINSKTFHDCMAWVFDMMYSFLKEK